MTQNIKLLVVEDSVMTTKIIRHLCLKAGDIDARFASSMAEAVSILEAERDEFFAALVDLNLPDAPNGEVVDLCLSKKIPTIVLTGTFSEERRESLLSTGIVDYVIKEGRYSYNYAVRLVKRLKANEGIKVMVADDSKTARHYLRDLLERHRYQVIEADNGAEAIRQLLLNSDTRILIADYNMPQIDGFQLTQLLRDKYEKTDLVILGLSGEGQSSLSAKFIKNGANDFLRKPFNQEEFYCRMMNCVETLELVEQLRDSLRRDPATGLWNAAHFRELANELVEQNEAAEHPRPLSLAVFEIDDFDRINADYGREVADRVLRTVGELVGEALSRFQVCRQMGPTFAAALPGIDAARCATLFDGIIARLNDCDIELEGQTLEVALSGGVCDARGLALDSMLEQAEEKLESARAEGGNYMAA
ncbi:GGDEF domain-containing response regulator [Allohahella marinimesophila]|uniref:Diguanylate cyclase n=1 Tax=Allohahella marinimesophila TaxID=1054972 RepID=A0ABP7NTH8_9GAMM